MELGLVQLRLDCEGGRHALRPLEQHEELAFDCLEVTLSRLEVDELGRDLLSFLTPVVQASDVR